MKRIVCLLLVVSIAYAGCEVKESSTSRIMGPDVQPVSPGVSHTPTIVETIVGVPGAVVRLSDCEAKIKELQRELSEARKMPKKDKASLARIAELETLLKSQRETLRAIIANLQKELSEAKAMPKQYKTLLVKLAELEAALGYQEAVERAEKALLVRINELEAAIESQRVVEREDEALLVRIDELEAAIESQRAEIENSKNMSRVYEVAIESQRLTIETLQKLCRMYEAEIESQGKSRSSEESQLSKEPEAGQQQGHEKDGKDDGVALP